MRQSGYGYSEGTFLFGAVKTHFYDNGDSKIQTGSLRDVFTCASSSAIGVLGKLIFQVTDPLLL